MYKTLEAETFLSATFQDIKLNVFVKSLESTILLFISYTLLQHLHYSELCSLERLQVVDLKLSQPFNIFFIRAPMIINK